MPLLQLRKFLYKCQLNLSWPNFLTYLQCLRKTILSNQPQDIPPRNHNKIVPYRIGKPKTLLD